MIFSINLSFSHQMLKTKARMVPLDTINKMLVNYTVRLSSMVFLVERVIDIFCL